ncbi:hypothetical protein HII31_06447 [Pseudocercospora fuligena]|uniref:Sulfotransferase domain-containing protein n=1 Tax=Pseudocercospora fuligena TaxID=685502 RepID=A0A8H6VI43_9PEZI|nr:hypothetical protein HII31_06447 [Pseudocercospora fuligena]
MGSFGHHPIDSKNAESNSPRDVFFFAHTRTASHVLCRLLSDQPGWGQSNYHFFEAFNFARKAYGWGPLESASQQDRDSFLGLLQKGCDEIQHVRKSAANEGKFLLLKEHTFYVWDPFKLSQSMWGGHEKSTFTVSPTSSDVLSNAKKTNPTLFPDSFLKTWRPIFLIRHPALSFESWYRAESGARDVDIFDKSWAFYTTFQYSRRLHDWYLSNATDSASMPIVIDADDMIEDPSTINKLCGMLGMDQQYVVREWDAIEAPKDAKPRELKFMSGYWNSTSIDKSKTSRDMDLDAKYSLWLDEFGANVGSELRRLVEEAMPDYEYMKSKKI